MDFLIVVLLSLLPSFIWLLFYLAEDQHPEPKRLIIKTFLSGIAFALVAFPVESIFVFLLKMIGFSRFSLIYLLSLAIIEEILKFIAVYLVVKKSPAFDEPIDAMIYMIVGALGFATLENIGAIASNQFEEKILSVALEMTIFRFIGATLLHSLSSGILGYFWALDIRRFQIKKFIFLGIILAAILHTIFNILIISYSHFIYSLSFLTIVGLWVLYYLEKLKQKSI